MSGQARITRSRAGWSPGRIARQRIERVQDRERRAVQRLEHNARRRA